MALLVFVAEPAVATVDRVAVVDRAADRAVDRIAVGVDVAAEAAVVAVAAAAEALTGKLEGQSEKQSDRAWLLERTVELFVAQLAQAVDGVAGSLFGLKLVP